MDAANNGNTQEPTLGLWEQVILVGQSQDCPTWDDLDLDDGDYDGDGEPDHLPGWYCAKWMRLLGEQEREEERADLADDRTVACERRREEMLRRGSRREIGKR